MLLDAPVPVSWYNNETVVFDAHTASVSGSLAEELAFKLAFRSYPTPAVFEWPDAINVLATSEPGNDVTVFELIVTVDNETTYMVNGTNGESGRLTSEIWIIVKPRGMLHVEVIFL